MRYKPAGYTSVAPYLIVADAAETMAFVTAAFGAEPLRVVRTDDGTIKHAEARIDDTVLMMGQMSGEHGAHVHLYIDDVEAAFARALGAGGVIVQQLALQADGDRRGGVRDRNGTTWWLARQNG